MRTGRNAHGWVGSKYRRGIVMLRATAPATTAAVPRREAACQATKRVSTADAVNDGREHADGSVADTQAVRMDGKADVDKIDAGQQEIVAQQYVERPQPLGSDRRGQGKTVPG